MKENRQLEFKEKISSSYLKTVSAFANYDGGSILFGVNDAGEVVGIGDIEQKCLPQSLGNFTHSSTPAFFISGIHGP